MYIVLRQERLRHNWTQSFVAQQIGITTQAVQLMEINKRKPSYEVLVKLEALFGKSHTELFSKAPPAA